MRWKTVLALALVVLLAAEGFAMCRTERTECRLAVLMYHHFDQESTMDTVVTAQRFREQMTALKEGGFTAVTLSQLLEYVDGGTPLPDRPVLITMDDGYTSNLTIAAPILEELGLCATVFVIGVNEGEQTYVHTGKPLLPARFSYEEAAAWVEKGVLDLQSHTYDMHQLPSYGVSGRAGVLQMEGEEPETYQAVLGEDMRLFRQRREGRVATDLVALAYPFGYHCQAAEDFFQAEGIAVTFTTQEHINRLRVGDPSSLRLLGRYNVTDRCTGQELVQRLIK